jgi:tape measure domain-containing protein
VAEISIGDIVARLRVDATDFSRGLQQAQQALQQFAQTKDRIIQNMQRLQQQGQSVGQTFQQFNQQITQTTQQFNQTTQALQQTNQTLTATTNVLHQARDAGAAAASAWQGILQVAAGIGVATSIQALVGQMVELARSTVQVGMQMQTLRASLTAITGDARAAQQAFAFIVQTSNATGQSLTTLAGSYRSLSAATRGTALEGEDTQRLFVGLANAARAYGLTTEQLGRVLVGFQQTVGKGKVEQEEFRQQIAEAFPNALQITARGFGVTTERLNEMISRGMDATTFVRTFTRQLESELPKGTQNVETAAQAFNRLGNEILLLKDAIAQSGLLKFLADVAAGTANVLEATRKAEEQQKTFIESAARQRFGGREVLGPDFEAMKGLEAQWQRLKDTIEGVYRTMATGNIIQRNVAENQLRPLLQEFDRVAKDISRLQGEAPERFRLQQGVQARMDVEGGGEDRLRVQQERERDVTAGEARIRVILERQRSQLETLRITPFLTELERAEEEFKVIQETTKQLRDLLQTMPAAVQQGMVKPLGATSPHRDMIMRAAMERGIDPQLALALVAQESGFDPRATSRAGAMGLMQLMPGTAAQFGLRGGGPEARQALTGVYEPEANVKAGLDYLAQLLKQFGGDVNRALTAYNAGPGRQGIPLPTGENATFARDVQARMPAAGQGTLTEQQRLQQETFAQNVQGRMPAAGQGTLAEQLRLQQAAEQAVEAQKGDPEARRRVFEQGREDLKRYDDAIKQSEQDQQTYQEAIDKATMALARQEEQAIKSLDTLVGKYQQSKEVRDADRVAALMQENTGNELIQLYGKEVLAIIEVRDAYNAEVEALRADFIAIKQRTEAQREAERAQEQFLQSLEDTNERLRTPRQQGFPLFTQSVDEELDALNARQQRQTDRPLFVDDQGRERARGLLEEQRRLERLTYTAGLFEQVGNSVGQAWGQALQSISSGTATVSEAFRAMAQSILQSLAQIASQEAFKALISFGVRMILGGATGGLTGTAPGGTDASFLGSTLGTGPEATSIFSSVGGGAGGGGGAFAFQHGGVVNRPTFSMLGESGPEAVIPLSRMGELFSRAPSAGGQAVGGAAVTIINVASQQAADTEKIKQEAMGRQVVVNHVLAELGAGEGSKINRAIRNLQR